MTIVVSRAGQDARIVARSRFVQEQHLQDYIRSNPQVIPMSDVTGRENVRLMALETEFPTDSGPIDVLAVDEEGEVYLIETKLYKNPDKRKVVAQVLDYGAALWSQSQILTPFRAWLETSSRTDEAKDLRSRMAEFFEWSPEIVEAMIQKVDLNFREGKFNFLVLMDQLDQRLRDLILFLNKNSRFSVYAMEVEYYEHDGYEIMIPKLYGAEVKKDLAPSPRTDRTWNEQTFFEDLEVKVSDEAHRKAVVRVYEFVRSNGAKIEWGTGASGSFNPKFPWISTRSPFSVYSEGSLRLMFARLERDKKSKLAASFSHDFRMALGRSLGDPDLKDRLLLPIQEWFTWVDALLDATEEALRLHPRPSS